MAAPRSGPFMGSTCLVLGAGVCASAVVSKMLHEGAQVLVAVRDEPGRRKIYAHIDKETPTARLHVLVGNLTVKGGTLPLVFHLNNEGILLDHVFSVSGGKFPEGTVLDISGESFVQTLAEKTLPHLVLLQIASGSIRDSPTSSWTIVTGGSGSKCEAADKALLTIGNSASSGVAAAAIKLWEERKKKSRFVEARLEDVVVKRDSAHCNAAFPHREAVNGSALAQWWATECALSNTTSGVVRVGEAELRSLQGK